MYDIYSVVFFICNLFNIILVVCSEYCILRNDCILKICVSIIVIKIKRKYI